MPTSVLWVRAHGLWKATHALTKLLRRQTKTHHSCSKSRPDGDIEGIEETNIETSGHVTLTGGTYHGKSRSEAKSNRIQSTGPSVDTALQARVPIKD